MKQTFVAPKLVAEKSLATVTLQGLVSGRDPCSGDVKGGCD
ncbi:MAG: hypothetical protein AB7S39_15680 [Gemmatimonadales bacterium]